MEKPYTITHELLAEFALSKKETFDIALENIQRDARKMSRATYSSGVYGRRWRKAIEKILEYHFYNFELSNEDCTRIGIKIERKLGELGYSYNYNCTEFTKK